MTETLNEVKLEPYSIIQELATALVQVGKMVEPKYLNPPLGMQSIKYILFKLKIIYFCIFNCIYNNELTNV